MPRLAIVDVFVGRARTADTEQSLRAALLQCCEEMGIRYFALSHHIDFLSQGGSAIRLHNYPATWQQWFDENGLGRSDPIHRASNVVSHGFAWSAVPAMIKLTPSDRSVLSQARIVGIGDGFTVPAHIPGEFTGSCSFAVDPNEMFPTHLHFVAQLIGGFAFEAARRITQMRQIDVTGQRTLTDRQRDCVLLAARGKTDWEISVILGISHETVIQHLKMARERYDVQKRAMLAIRALYDGLISFSDIIKP